MRRESTDFDGEDVKARLARWKRNWIPDVEYIQAAPRQLSQGPIPEMTFQILKPEDLEMLHDWLCRPHVSEWWGQAPSLGEMEADYLPMTRPESTTRGYIASLEGQPIGFIQSYTVLGSGGGWWPEETDPGARGIDQFLAHPEHLGRGLGTAMIRAFVKKLCLDPSVTKVQADPSPNNKRAIRSYLRAGFRRQGSVDTPDGPAVLMICRPQLDADSVDGSRGCPAR
jgi:RimJ/RimL family protein N-acetyltransferase